MKAYTGPVGNSYGQIRELRQLLLATMGKTFRVLFISRGKNKPRDMRARLKRVSDITTDRWNYQATVWDIEKKAWRVIPLERVVFFKCGDSRWVMP